MGLKNWLAKKLGVTNIMQAPVAVQSAFIRGFPVYSQVNTISQVNAYATSEDLYSIVRRIAKTVNMIPLKVYKIVDDKAFKEYEFECSKKNYSPAALIKQQFLKSKALELVDDKNPYQQLLNNPNPTYSKTEYREGFHTFLLLTGNSYVYAPTLEYGVNAGTPGEMWLNPSQFMSLQVSETYPRRVIGYRLQIAEIVYYKPEEIMHTRYFNPQYNYVGNELIGLSPLTAGAKTLDRGDAETDYSVSAFQNSGISGLVSSENLQTGDIEQGALGKMKSDFYNEASGVTNARKLLFTAGKWVYTAIGLSPVDMDVLASMKLTFKKLCNLYGVSDMLFNNDGIGNGVGGKTDIVYKDLYTNAALPAAFLERDSYNRHITPMFNKGKEKYFVDVDITGIAELQDDMKDMAQVYSQLPVMNPVIIAKAFGWDTTGVEDKWFMKNGYQTIEDAIAGMSAPDIPIDTPNGN